MKNFPGGKELKQDSITSKMHVTFLAALGGCFLCLMQSRGCELQMREAKNMKHQKLCLNIIITPSM